MVEDRMAGRMTELTVRQVRELAAVEYGNLKWREYPKAVRQAFYWMGGAFGVFLISAFTITIAQADKLIPSPIGTVESNYLMLLTLFMLTCFVLYLYFYWHGRTLLTDEFITAWMADGSLLSKEKVLAYLKDL